MKLKLGEAAERIVWSPNRVSSWAQTRTAARTAVGQGADLNGVTDKQEPNCGFVASVSSTALINTTWLFTGRGVALVTLCSEVGRRATYGDRRMFEGLPKENGDCLGHMFEVPFPAHPRQMRPGGHCTSERPIRQEGLCESAPGI